MGTPDEATRTNNQKFIERLLAAGWNQERDFVVHPTDTDIRVLWRPNSGELLFSPKYGQVLRSEDVDLRAQADPRIFELKSVRIIEEGLRTIPLPTLSDQFSARTTRRQKNSYTGPSHGTFIPRSPTSGPYLLDS